MQWYTSMSNGHNTLEYEYAPAWICSQIFSTKNNKNKISREYNNKNSNITEMRRSRKIRCQASTVCVYVHKWIVFTSPGIFIYISIFLQLCSGLHFKLHGRFANMLVCVPKCPLLVFRTILFLFILAFFLEWCEL